MLEDSSAIEQDFGSDTDFVDALFLPSCIEEMVESETYTKTKLPENYFYPRESIVSKKASVAINSQESSSAGWKVIPEAETENVLNHVDQRAFKNKLHKDTLPYIINPINFTKCFVSSTSSASDSPTGILTPLEHQNELWKAIESLDIFLVDKDIIEACKASNCDQSSKDGDSLDASSVSFAEFLQQYKELIDWLKQVQELTQREVACLSEKYLNLSYHEEMLDRSPRRQFLNDYSHQLLLRCPNVADEVKSRMAMLNAQWTDLERAINDKYSMHNTEAMLQDLQDDMKTLRHWLETVETALLPLTVSGDWTPAEVEKRLQEHQTLQQDIESHNRIINAVLQLSQRLDLSEDDFEKNVVTNSFHLVALNIQQRWHSVWLQSLEWQCRLEALISRRKGYDTNKLDFGGCSVPIVDESSLSSSSSIADINNLLEINDKDTPHASHLDVLTNNTRWHSEFRHKDFRSAFTDKHKSRTSVFQGILPDDYVHFSECSISNQDNVFLSGRNGDALKKTFNSDILSSLKQDRSFAKQKSSHFTTNRKWLPAFVDSALHGPVEPTCTDSFSNISCSCSSNLDVLSGSFPARDNDNSCGALNKSLFDLSSGDSANISESESKMGDYPPLHRHLDPKDPAELLATSSEEGDGEILAARNGYTIEGKDIGYSSDSLSNDEDYVLHHQIGIECKFPGKCEVASDGPLGDKITLPSVETKPEYYFMTMVDIDSTDKTDNGDTTDSGGERITKIASQCKAKSTVAVSRLEEVMNFTDEEKSKYRTEKLKNYTCCGGQCKNRIEKLTDFTCEDKYKHSMEKSQSFDDSLKVSDPEAAPFRHRYFKKKSVLHEFTFEIPQENEYNCPIYEFYDSDNLVESKENLIQYLIDHAEDLVKNSSPRKQQPKSPSKQTQTDPYNPVENSCDASGEDNSELESHRKDDFTKEDLSTATDDADETLCNSVVNISSVDDADRTLVSPHFTSIYDSPYLRKQTCRSHRKGETRPWSVVGLDNINLSRKCTNNVHRISSVSESAINHLHFRTPNELPSWLLTPNKTITSGNASFTQRIHKASTSCDQPSSGLVLPTLQPSDVETTFSSYQENQQNSDSSPTAVTLPLLGQRPHFGCSSQTSLHKTSSRHSLCTSSQEEQRESHSTVRHSMASDVLDTAELKTQNSEEPQTAVLDLAASDAEDVHNVSGSLSEGSAWDNYQMLYPTASEDPGEELLAWERQDELEFDDDFQIKHHNKLFMKNEITTVQKHGEFSVSRQSLPCEDSDSELDDFHDILDQSEQALRKAEQSLKKMKTNPDEIIMTYDTNMRCLMNICHHLKSENVPESDVQRVKALMCQWEELHGLATEYHRHLQFLGDVTDLIVAIQSHIQEVEDNVPCDGFTTTDELTELITSLQERKITLEQQEHQLNQVHKELMEFSALHPMIHIDSYIQELTHTHKAITGAVKKVTDQVDQQTEWLEYLERQHSLRESVTFDRKRLHTLLCQQQYGMQISKQDVLKELEILQNNLSLHESKLSLLQSLWVRLTKSPDSSAQNQILASMGDIRNQLLVMSKRCRQIYYDIEEDDDTIFDQQPNVGKLAMYTTTLHEAVGRHKKSLSHASSMENLSLAAHTKSKVTHSCTSWVRSLSAQVVAVMIVTGLIFVFDPDILDHLTNLTLKISPELRYIAGPPAM